MRIETQRPTVAEIDLDALRSNFRALRGVAAHGALMVVVKADAYGHGAPAVARTLERVQGLAGFCVALLEEAIELREAGIVAPILVMGGHYGSAHDEVIARDLVPVVHDAEHLGARRANGVRGGSAAGAEDAGHERLGHRKVRATRGHRALSFD